MTPHLVGTIDRTSDARSLRRNHYAPCCASGVQPSAPGDLRVSLRRRGESSGLACRILASSVATRHLASLGECNVPVSDDAAEEQPQESLGGETCKGPVNGSLDRSRVLGADPFPLAALLLGSLAGSMRPPRALRHRGGAARHRSSTEFSIRGPKGSMTQRDSVLYPAPWRR
jgi:hypothetical protein